MRIPPHFHLSTKLARLLKSHRMDICTSSFEKGELRKSMVEMNPGVPNSRNHRLAVCKVTVVIALVISLMMAAAPAVAGSKRGARTPTSVVAGSVSGGGNVKVTVVGTGKSAKTNSSGLFVLGGTNLAGRHQLNFLKDSKVFSTAIRVPAGSKLSLQNTKLNGDGTAQAEQEDIEVLGTLNAVDCGATPNTATIAPSGGGTTVIMSFDTATTEIVDDSTNAKVADCATFAANYLNARVKAEGTQAADGSIVADRIELNPGKGKGDPGQDVHFNGVVQSVSCPTSIVVQLADSTEVTATISDSTEIKLDDSASHSSATCTDIGVGAKVDVEGIPQADGSVSALEIEVRQNHMESNGTIDSLNCDATPPSFSFTPDGAGSALVVTIGSTTEIEAGDIKPASCADLTSGPAKVEGVTQADGAIVANEVEQEGNDDNNGGGNGGGGNGEDHGGKRSGGHGSDD